MAENNIPKWLQMAEVWAKIIAGLAIPVAISVFGTVLSAQQREADRKESERKQMIDVGTFLTSEDPRKVQFAAAILERMRTDGVVVPPILVEAFTMVANSGVQPSADKGPGGKTGGEKAGSGALQGSASAVEQTAREAAAKVLGGLTPRVYLHIAAESDRAAAEKLRQTLRREKLGDQLIVAPGVERRDDVPSVAELRYYKLVDRDEASKVADLVGKLAGTSLKPVHLERFEASQIAKPRTYEVWFPAGDVKPVPGGA